ncbi:MAG: hypothetical protein BGO34_11275 [Bacteroidia bacterium 44-10]|nr:MAG: hypothetical protein BGO34_11275 [Bacteroidia bacterium 44-10]
MEIKQYELVLVNLDPTVGSEIKKTRPCVVISPMQIDWIRTKLEKAENSGFTNDTKEQLLA